MYFVLNQRGGKYGYSITESGWYFSVFLFTWHMYALLFLQLWHMIVLLIILIMAWWYHFWHIKFLKVSIYFILSSEIHAYLQWLNVIFSQVKWYCINSQVSDTIYVFTVAKIWKFLAQMHFKRFGKWDASWKWCYGHWSVLAFLPMMSLIARLNVLFSATDVWQTAAANRFRNPLTAWDSFIKMIFCTIFKVQTVFTPKIIPTKHTGSCKVDAKWLG